MLLASLAAFVPKQSVRGRNGLLRRAPDITDVQAEWQIQEEGARVDEIPRFTVGHGEHTVTFWNALSNTNPKLRQRTPEELRARAASLVEHAVGREPKVLRSAHRQADGSWAGTIDGHHRIVHAASEGRSASGAARRDRR